jgi:hypothetical protein
MIIQSKDLPTLAQYTKVHYRGDVCNQPGDGYIKKVHPADRWGGPYYTVRLYDGRSMGKKSPQSFFGRLPTFELR